MPSPRLSAAEEAAWRGFNEMRNTVISRVSRDLWNRSGLTEADYAVLLTLVGAPRRTLRSQEILERLQWEPSRLSHQLSRMQSRGSITRERCPDDGRSVHVTLTDDGFDAIRRATPDHFRSVREWFVDALTPEQLVAMAEISEAVIAHAAAERTAPPPAATVS